MSFRVQIDAAMVSGQISGLPEVTAGDSICSHTAWVSDISLTLDPPLILPVLRPVEQGRGYVAVALTEVDALDEFHAVVTVFPEFDGTPQRRLSQAVNADVPHFLTFGPFKPGTVIREIVIQRMTGNLAA